MSIVTDVRYYMLGLRATRQGWAAKVQAEIQEIRHLHGKIQDEQRGIERVHASAKDSNDELRSITCSSEAERGARALQSSTKKSLNTAENINSDLKVTATAARDQTITILTDILSLLRM
ncbi:hypothetical protein N7456_007427 [Penicillium angulare]|uniref:Uncharacterized protein n=1 Tax=Penicillium angulare TaxID=116970 RepID=A0A9W9K8R8_9EURO|nr:hypothetical protein N7456_007427 [Penicillium angulare]